MKPHRPSTAPLLCVRQLLALAFGRCIRRFLGHALGHFLTRFFARFFRYFFRCFFRRSKQRARSHSQPNRRNFRAIGALRFAVPVPSQHIAARFPACPARTARRACPRCRPPQRGVGRVARRSLLRKTSSMEARSRRGGSQVTRKGDVREMRARDRLVMRRRVVHDGALEASPRNLTNLVSSAGARARGANDVKVVATRNSESGRKRGGRKRGRLGSEMPGSGNLESTVILDVGQSSQPFALASSRRDATRTSPLR